MKEIVDKIKKAQSLFRDRLLKMKELGGFTKDRYERFLSMQYHLTKGVQRHFYAVASHSAMARKPELRKWLIQFAAEEEFHFEIARGDLAALKAEPLPMPLDTKLWWLYFDSIVKENPFIRLGATCILENISGGSDGLLDELVKAQPFFNKDNLRFLVIHKHGPNLDHGGQVLDVLTRSNLTPDEYKDLQNGADITTIFYMRAAHWVIFGEPLG